MCTDIFNVVNHRFLLRGDHAQHIEESFSILLLDVDTIEGELPRRDQRNSDKTDHPTMENVLWIHGGMVTGGNKGLPGFVPL